MSSHKVRGISHLLLCCLFYYLWLSIIVSVSPLFTLKSFCSSAEIQNKLDHEQVARQRAETRLLDTEKEKSELSVDLGQLKQQLNTIQRELRAENEKVCIWLRYHLTLSCIIPIGLHMGLLYNIGQGPDPRERAGSE